MTAPVQTPKNVRNAWVAALAVCAAASVACGVNYFEIPIETPIQPKLDVSAFQRVLVAGFVTGGDDEVDANQETVRLLRSQLRSRSDLRVIDADAMPLIDVAREQLRAATADAPQRESSPAAAIDDAGQPLPLPEEIRNEKDLEEVPEPARKQLKFVFLENIDDALAAAFDPPPTVQAKDKRGNDHAAAA